MNKKTTKRALLSSVLALFLCFTMLLGTTYAWFTDSVTSTNNIIASGTLDVAMYWADGTKAVPADDAGWTDASTGAIFNYDKWEPGYVQVRHIKIANEGTLALKYAVSIVANGTVSDLSDVIDVYYVDPAVQVADRTALTNANKIGTLTDVLAGLATTGNGTLEAGKADTITLALKMQETAGNEYQEKSIGTSFAVQLVATQLAYEEDSFDENYDQGALYIKNTSASTDVPDNAAESEKFKTDAGTIVDVPADVLNNLPDAVEKLTFGHSDIVADPNGKTISIKSAEFFDQDGNVVDLSDNTTPMAVTLPAQTTFAAGESVLIYHDGELVADAVVNADGTISYEALHFCEVVVAVVPEDVVAYTGGVAYKTFVEAVAASKGGEVTVLKNIAESFKSLENVTLTTNVAGGVTVENTFEEDWVSFNNVNVTSGVTLIIPNVFSSAKNASSVNVIEGVLVAGTETNTTTLYHGYNAKTIVQNGGQIVVSGDTVIRYNSNAEAGIYVYGDGNDDTVEFSSGLYSGGYIGAYSGTFYAEDAIINCGDLRLDFKKGSSQEPDSYPIIDAKFVDSKVSVASELRLYQDAHLTLVGTEVTAGKAQVRAEATPVVTVDENSVIKAAMVENVTGALVEAILGEDGVVSFKALVAKVGTKNYDNLADAIAAATKDNGIVLLTDVNADFGIALAEGITLDGNGHSITYNGTEYGYHLVKLETGATLKNVVLNNYRARTESTANGTVTLTNVTVNMDNDETGIDLSRGSGVAVLTNVVCKGIKDEAHLNPSTTVQVGYDPYGDVLLGGAWALNATDCQFGSLHGWNTRNNSDVYLNNTTSTVFRMHYWPGRTLYVNGVETAWAESGAIPVAHDVGGCWSVQPAFK